MGATSEDTRRLGDRYGLVAELGRGGTSVVWRGYDELIERDVAVKVLSRSVDKRFWPAIRAEARAAGRLTNAHVAHVYDYGETTDEDGVTTPYLVMELVEGDSLSRRLSGGRALPWPEAASIGAQVAAALAAAHARGLVHRDVKPDNVILTDEGVKVIDFGISAVIGSRDAEEDGQLVGTPAYVAPERLADVPVGPAADVYALGVLLYRSLTGYLPWDVDGRTAILRAHMFVEPMDLPAGRGLPGELADIVHACLDKEPGHRPPAADLAAQLSTLVAHQPEPGEAGARERPRRRRVLVPSLLGIFVALFSGAWAFTSDPLRDHPQPAAARTPVTCTAKFSVDRDWGSGFDAHVTVTNVSTATIQGWQVSFAFPGTQHVARATASAGDLLRQDGTTVTAVPRTPSQAVAPHATVTIPVRASYEADNPIPTRVDLNAMPCQTVITGAAYQPATTQPAGPRTTQPSAPRPAGPGTTRQPRVAPATAPGGNGHGHGHGHGHAGRAGDGNSQGDN